jgi:ribosome-associated protein
MVSDRELSGLVVEALEDLKGQEILVLDVRGITSITDWMVIASGTSDRHVKSLADNVARNAKAAGHTVLGMEGESEGEWVLIDLGDVIAHVMQPKTRDFYKLERLWGDTGDGTRDDD